MTSEKIYWNEIIFYVVSILVALSVRIFLPFESFRPGIEPIGYAVSLIFYWGILTYVVLNFSFIVYAKVATSGLFKHNDVPRDRLLSSSHFSLSTATIVTSLIAERIYQALGSFPPTILVVPLIFYLIFKLAQKIGPWSFS